MTLTDQEQEIFSSFAVTLWKKELTIIPNLQGALPAREFKLNRIQHPFLVFDLPDYDLIGIYDLSKLSHLRILVWMAIFSLTTFVGWVDLFAPLRRPTRHLDYQVLVKPSSGIRKTSSMDCSTMSQNVNHMIQITADDGCDVTSWVNCIKKVRELRSKRGIDVVAVKTD